MVAALWVTHSAQAAEHVRVQPEALDLAQLVRALPAKVANAQDARSRLEDLRSNIKSKRAEAGSRIATERDPLLSRKRTDLLWSLEMGLNDDPSLDLTQLGFRKIREGAFDVQGERARELRPTLFSTLDEWRDPEDFEEAAKYLRESGFREQDLTALSQYLLNTSMTTFARAKHRQLVDQMAQTVRARRQSGGSVSTEELLALMYQIKLNAAEAQRRFVEGAFNSLDRQRQLILASVIEQMTPEQYWVSISAPELSREAIDAQLDLLASGAYVQLMEDAELELTRFRGLFKLHKRRVHYGQVNKEGRCSIHTGVSPTDGGTGPSRSHRERAVARVWLHELVDRSVGRASGTRCWTR